MNIFKNPLVLIGLALLLLGGGAAVYTMTRGLRNNNPGNLRLSSDKWQGLQPIQEDADFFQFVNPTYGIRALAKVLQTYMTRYGLTTVANIITRWAPPSENNTEAYIASVASSMNVDPNTPLSDADLASLTKAIIKHENGLNPYSDAIIDGAIALV
jgi:hypothetical protein